MSRQREDRRTARRAARGERKRLTAVAYLFPVPAGEAPTPQTRGLETCPCPKDCTLHRDCLPCVPYHTHKNVLPRCLRWRPRRATQESLDTGTLARL